MPTASVSSSWARKKSRRARAQDKSATVVAATICESARLSGTRRCHRNPVPPPKSQSAAPRPDRRHLMQHIGGKTDQGAAPWARCRSDGRPAPEVRSPHNRLRSAAGSGSVCAVPDGDRRHRGHNPCATRNAAFRSAIDRILEHRQPRKIEAEILGVELQHGFFQAPVQSLGSRLARHPGDFGRRIFS